MQHNLSFFRSKGYILSLLIIILSIIATVIINSPFFTLSIAISDIFIFLSIGWDFSSGTTNYINFGISFFFGVGAFSTGYLYFNYHLSVPFLILISSILGLLSGTIFTVLTLRVKGVFFTLLSLLLPLIGTYFILAFWTVLKMPTIGFYDLPPISYSLQNTTIYISLILIVVLTFIYILNSTHFGLLLRGIGDDEEAIVSQGINTFPYKVLVFSISMGIVGLAGSIYALLMSFAGVDTFALEFLLYPMVIAIFGGKGKILGAVPAGFIIILSSQYLQSYVGDLTLIMFTILAIILFLFVPNGISRWYK
ncbi:MAG: branched-chain amino acid ABC transporter permease [Candidatus Micrarchaeaceae archaeon]